MPRRPNQIRTVHLTLSTTPAVKGYLEALVATGLYGKNTAEAAERLVASSIERLIREETLQRRSRKR